MGVEGAAVERRRLAGRRGLVRDNRVGMQLRVACSGGAMPEGCDREAVAGDDLTARLAAPGPARVSLDVPERVADRRVVRLSHRSRDLARTYAVEDRHRL